MIIYIIYSFHTLCVVSPSLSIFSFFFFNDTATTEIYTLSLHDALPISRASGTSSSTLPFCCVSWRQQRIVPCSGRRDRKSTRLNSSHSQISYAVFCLKKKKKTNNKQDHMMRQTMQFN